MSALAIRGDISLDELRWYARRESDGRVSTRLIAIANALDGMDRASAARLAGMDRQTLRDWVHRYNAEGIAGLHDRPKPGCTPKLSEGQMASLKAIVLTGPDPAADKIGRWRVVDLCRYVEDRWDVRDSETGILRLPRLQDEIERRTGERVPKSRLSVVLKKILWATDGRAPVGFGVRHPTQGDRQWRSRPAPRRPSPPSVPRWLSLWN
jgi:transposase